MTQPAPAPRVAILVPTRNEEAGIGATLDSLPLHEVRGLGYDPSVWIVDGNSTDRTLEIAAARGARIIRQTGRGKAQGVQQALKAIDADIVVMLDGDATYPGHLVPHFLGLIEEGHDVVMGSRFRGEMESGAMSRTNRIGNRGLSAIARALYGQPVTDVCTGMWAFDKKAIDTLTLVSEHFNIEAELFAESAKAGLRITETPIPYARRLGDSHLGGIPTGLRIGGELLRKRFEKVAARPVGA